MRLRKRLAVLGMAICMIAAFSIPAAAHGRGRCAGHYSCMAVLRDNMEQIRQCHRNALTWKTTQRQTQEEADVSAKAAEEQQAVWTGNGVCPNNGVCVDPENCPNNGVCVDPENCPNNGVCSGPGNCPNNGVCVDPENCPNNGVCDGSGYGNGGHHGRGNGGGHGRGHGCW